MGEKPGLDKESPKFEKPSTFKNVTSETFAPVTKPPPPHQQPPPVPPHTPTPGPDPPQEPRLHLSLQTRAPPTTMSRSRTITTRRTGGRRSTSGALSPALPVALPVPGRFPGRRGPLRPVPTPSTGPSSVSETTPNQSRNRNRGSVPAAATVAPPSGTHTPASRSMSVCQSSFNRRMNPGSSRFYFSIANFLIYSSWATDVTTDAITTTTTMTTGAHVTTASGCQATGTRRSGGATAGWRDATSGAPTTGSVRSWRSRSRRRRQGSTLSPPPEPGTR